jgi:polysaccharide export outer membrane protein
LLLTSATLAEAQQQPVVPAAQPAVATSDTRPASASSNASNPSLGDYVVSPEDVLDVNVMDVPEVSRVYRVSSSGFLTLPLLAEPVPAAGETLEQLSRLIAAKFRDAGMLNNAQVTVALKETRLHTVLVSGEVKRPQPYTVYGPTRLLELLSEAGGLTDAAGEDAVITRGDIGARADLEESAKSDSLTPPSKGQSFTLNVRKLVRTGDEQSNILLYPGDRVTVQRAELIYILGAVAHPGGYVMDESRQQITVLKALALAGDVGGFARKKNITLLRRDPASPDEMRSQIPVNYLAMVKGQIADLRLKPDDILYVPESTRTKITRTTVGSLVTSLGMAGGYLAIYH